MTKYGLTKYEDPTRRLRARVNVLAALVVLTTATALFASWRFTVARNLAYQWQYMALTGGKGDGL